MANYIIIRELHQNLNFATVKIEDRDGTFAADF